uniref:CRAL/TRIO N-terminal domain-containing protein n=1 Tax=Aegilops tauschii subsp. strangulata TaxID=200361 RepID=A0A453GDX1_AEGTS
RDYSALHKYSQSQSTSKKDGSVEERRSMASSMGGGNAGEGEWLKVAELRAMAEAQDPHVKEVDNLTLRRFLRARGHAVGKASAMLLKFVAWRREAVPGGVMLAELVRTELSHEMAYMAGADRAGRPVMLAFPAKHFSATRDMAGFKRTFTHLTFALMISLLLNGVEFESACFAVIIF